jgi:hypothetical protein
VDIKKLEIWELDQLPREGRIQGVTTEIEIFDQGTIGKDRIIKVSIHHGISKVDLYHANREFGEASDKAGGPDIEEF